MKDTQEALETRLVELRSAFDAAFARKAELPPGTRRGYLGIRLNDAPYALDLDEVASVKKHVPVTPLPSAHPQLLGVAGVSGMLAAVYDLCGLLGLSSGPEPVWFVLVRVAPVVFAVHAIEGQLQPELHAAEVAEPAGIEGASSDLSFRPGLSRPVIRLGRLVERLGSVLGDSEKEGVASR